jgi:hypothetical protein
LEVRRQGEGSGKEREGILPSRSDEGSIEANPCTGAPSASSFHQGREREFCCMDPCVHRSREQETLAWHKWDAKVGVSCIRMDIRDDRIADVDGCGERGGALKGGERHGEARQPRITYVNHLLTL